MIETLKVTFEQKIKQLEEIQAQTTAKVSLLDCDNNNDIVYIV
jgi:hypothetical protein